MMLVNFVHPIRFPPAPPAGTVLHSSDTPGASSYTVGPAITSVIIKIWGGGAGGSGPMVDTSSKEPVAMNGYGGGGGGYSTKTIAVSPGDVLPATIGAGATGGSLNGFGNSGGNSSFSFGAHSLAANGSPGGLNSTGGTASGGSTNTSGRNAGLTNQYDGGGAGNGGGDQTTTGEDGTSPGGGGAGASAEQDYGGDGQPGRYQVIMA